MQLEEEPCFLMALYTWISQAPKGSLIDTFASLFRELGLEVSKEASSDQQIYAIEALGQSTYQAARVNVIVSWVCSSKSQYQVEVRSSEPMFKKDTRCETFAKALRSASPPVT